MQIRYLPNNVEKELSTRIKIGNNGNGKECQNIIRIDGNGNEKEIWSNFKVIDLGSGTSFNVASVLPNHYQNLSVNNFFSNTEFYQSGAGHGTSTSGDDNDGFVQSVKSYKASTGVLTFYHRYWGDYGSGTRAIRVYCVLKLNKVINLGTAESFNIANLYPTKYQEFTTNNFMYRNIATQQGGVTCYSPSCPFWTGISVSYNSSTGILTSYSYGRWIANQGLNMYLLPLK